MFEALRLWMADNKGLTALGFLFLAIFLLLFLPKDSRESPMEAEIRQKRLELELAIHRSKRPAGKCRCHEIPPRLRFEPCPHCKALREWDKQRPCA